MRRHIVTTVVSLAWKRPVVSNKSFVQSELFSVLVSKRDFSLKMATKIPTIKLNNGREVPILGLGTWKVSKIL